MKQAPAISIDGFQWDAGNLTKCLARGFTVAEIQGFLVSETTLRFRDDRHSEFEERFIAVGMTSQGQRAFVVYAVREIWGEHLVRPISARRMHEKEYRKYVLDTQT